MTRLSKDEIKYGRVWNGHDYVRRPWVVDGMIQDCGHSQEMKPKRCSNGHRLAWNSILEIPEDKKGEDKQA